MKLFKKLSLFVLSVIGTFSLIGAVVLTENPISEAILKLNDVQGAKTSDETEVIRSVCAADADLSLIDDELNMMPKDLLNYSKGKVTLNSGRSIILNDFCFYTFVIYSTDYYKLMATTASSQTMFSITFDYIYQNGSLGGGYTGTTYDEEARTISTLVAEQTFDRINVMAYNKTDVAKIFVTFAVPQDTNSQATHKIKITDLNFCLDGNLEAGDIRMVQLYKGQREDYDSESEYLHAPCGLEGNELGPYSNGSSLNVSVPYGSQTFNVSSLQTALKAYDEIDRKFTTLVLEKDDYTANKTVLDNPLDVVFSSHDNVGNISKFTFKVTIYDNVPPSIKVKNLDFKLSYKTAFSKEVLLSNYEISDNYIVDGKVEVTGFDYAISRNKVEDVKIRVTATDASGNVNYQDTTLHIIDDVKPVITGLDHISVKAGEMPTDQEILKNFSGQDEVDGTCELKIENNSSKGNESFPGNYSFDVVCQDKSGNSTYKTVTMEIADTEGPEFYVSQTYLETTYGGVSISPASAVKALIKNGVLEKKNYSYSEYMGGDYKEDQIMPVGEYYTTLAAYSEDGETSLVDLTIAVKENQTETTETLSFWDRICLFFTNIWAYILKLFSISI